MAPFKILPQHVSLSPFQDAEGLFSQIIWFLANIFIHFPLKKRPSGVINQFDTTRTPKIERKSF